VVHDLLGGLAHAADGHARLQPRIQHPGARAFGAITRQPLALAGHDVDAIEVDALLVDVIAQRDEFLAAARHRAQWLHPRVAALPVGQPVVERVVDLALLAAIAMRDEQAALAGQRLAALAMLGQRVDEMVAAQPGWPGDVGVRVADAGFEPALLQVVHRQAHAPVDVGQHGEVSAVGRQARRREVGAREGFLRRQWRQARLRQSR
jgi:hypothetical protein